MKLCNWLLIAGVVALAADASAQSSVRQPHIGYVYPAGGRQGAVVEVLIGGQAINGVARAYVSGAGVHAANVQFVKPLTNDQLKELRAYVTGLIKERRIAQGLKPNANAAPEESEESTPDLAALLNHPLLRNLDKMSLPELEHWAAQFLNTYKRQMSPQLVEMAVVEMTIDADAAPGDRELRLARPGGGLTNPLCFQVGTLPEVREHEPNDRTVFDTTPVELPAVLNGQIMPGDADRFRFNAKAGSQLVIRAQARCLMPYLADAVPGWFQAALTLYDAAGKEVGFADHYLFEPDPVLFFKVPKEGEYEVEIRDSIYRGRQDFVYRIALGDLPFVTRMTPLGGREGEETVATAAGWNLSENKLALNTQAGGVGVRETLLQNSNPVRYAVDSLPECVETEPNDDTEHALELAPPQIVNGCVAQAGDVDVYRFQGHANDEVVAEIAARKLNSPLDSVLRLTDGSGRVIEWNDDCPDKESGLLTHHADSYLRTRLPADGTFFIQVADTQRNGGEAYAYRLRVGPPRPDFALRLAPSSINVAAGRFAKLTVHAIRKDGFDGDIDIALKDAPSGFALSGARIPSGRESVRMTLSAPPTGLDEPVELHFEGQARIGEQTVVRPAIPSEDMMQAFDYRHLVPSQELLVAVTGPKNRAANIQLADNGPTRIPVGGTAEIRVRTPQAPVLRQVRLELSEPPKGLTLEGLTVVPEGLVFHIRASGDLPAVGYKDNLIVEAYLEPPAEPQPADKKPRQQKKRTSFGVLPAIPFEIVRE